MDTTTATEAAETTKAAEAAEATAATDKAGEAADQVADDKAAAPAEATAVTDNATTDPGPDAAVLQAQIDALTAERDQLAAQAVAARSEAVTSVKAAMLARAGIPETYLPQVVGDDATAWEASVKALADLRGTTARRPDPVQATGQQAPASDKTSTLVNLLFGDS